MSQPQSDSNGNLGSKFIVVNSAAEAVEKLEAVLAQMCAEAAAEQAAGQAAKASEPAKPVGVQIEEAGPGFNPDDVIAQLTAAVNKDRAAKAASSSNGAGEAALSSSLAEQLIGALAAPEVQPILRRMVRYFSMEVDAAREAYERKDTATMLGHLVMANVLRQAGEFLVTDGGEMLANARAQWDKSQLGQHQQDLGADGTGADGGTDRDKSKEN